MSTRDAFPKVLCGVAIFSDVLGVHGEAPDTTRFSIFIGGLSNGTADVTILKDGKVEIVPDIR